MKKILLILSLVFFSGISIFAQEDRDDEKIRDKMREYIQQRMSLTKNEAERFAPVFLRYFREWRTTLRDFRQDKLILKQKIVELRLRYRTEFRTVIGEKRGDEVYDHQDRFIRELQNIRKERLENRTGPRNRLRALTI